MIDPKGREWKYRVEMHVQTPEYTQNRLQKLQNWRTEFWSGMDGGDVDSIVSSLLDMGAMLEELVVRPVLLDGEDEEKRDRDENGQQ